MPKPHLPIYQIQDFNAQAQRENYFYLSSFAAHLKEHLFTRKPHKHDFFIILFIKNGTGTHTIDFNRYEVEPNMFFFMTPGQVHSWELSDDTDGFVIFFTQEFYLREFPHKKLFSFPCFNSILHKPTLFISIEEKSIILQIYQTLQEEFKSKEILRNEMLSRYLDVLLIYLTRFYQAQGTETKVEGGQLSLLQRFENLIEKHYKEHLPVTYYADHLNITAKHLKEICKLSLGKTTNEIIQERAILEAKRLLVHSELTSSQIAAELGYFDITYFFRFFKKHTGYTPEQFRSLTQ